MQIGRHSSIAATGSNISAQVEIGNYTSVAPYVQMHPLHNHACIDDHKLVSTYQFPNYPDISKSGKIVIGSDVWIGRNAVLLGDITIGHGSIIGAYCVVARDIPPYAVVVGNPAQIKRYRFTPDQIAKLLEIKWWDQKEIDINALIDVESFLARY